jgi:sugar phosphate isomerase/epimerase
LYPRLSLSPLPCDRIDKPLTLAGSAKWSHGRQRVEWLCAHDFAIELAPDPEDMAGLERLIWPLVQKDHPLRFHGFLPGYELGDDDPAAARRALERHKALVDAVGSVPDAVITCHIGLTPGRLIDGRRAVANLSALVEYAAARRVVIALENLKHGPTSIPQRHLDWAVLTGARITLDLGHALSTDATSGMGMDDYIDAVASRLVEVHYYERETDRHYPPADMGVLGPLVDRLMRTDCRWWTIELEDLAEMAATRRMTLNYLNPKTASNQGVPP